MGNKSRILAELIDGANEIFSHIWLIFFGLFFVAMIGVWFESLTGIDGSGEVVFKLILFGIPALFVIFFLWALLSGLTGEKSQRSVEQVNEGISYEDLMSGYSRFDDKDEKFVRKLKEQMLKNDESIFLTLLKRSKEFQASPYWSDYYDMNRFSHDLLIAGITGKFYETYYIVDKCRSCKTDFEEGKKLEEKLSRVSVKASEKTLIKLIDEFKVNVKNYKFSRSNFLYQDFAAFKWLFYPHHAVSPVALSETDQKNIFSFVENNIGNREEIFESLEKARKNQIKKSIAIVNKARSKEKITAKNAESFLTLADLYLYDKDPLERNKAKSIINEFIDSANNTKITPKMKEAISNAEFVLKHEFG